MGIFGKKPQPKPKDEHPMHEEWEQLRAQADKQGLLHNDGTFADPPQGGSGLCLSNPPTPRVDHSLISKVYR